MTDSLTPTNRNFDPYDLEEHTDHADVIRHAKFKIKSDQCNNHSHRKKNYKFPCPVCEKNAIKINNLFNVHYVKIGYTAKCNGIIKAEFDILIEDDDIPFH